MSNDIFRCKGVPTPEDMQSINFQMRAELTSGSLQQLDYGGGIWNLVISETWIMEREPLKFYSCLLELISEKRETKYFVAET